MSVCNMVGGTPPKDPEPEKEKPELGLRELSFEKALLDGREVIVPIDKKTGAHIAGMRSCGITSGLDKPTVMHIEIELESGSE